jgi:hypothetical protein
MQKLLGVWLAMIVWLFGLSFVSLPDVNAQGYEWNSLYEDPNGPWWAGNIDLVNTENWTADGLVNVIKWAVNRMLWILGLIALIVVLYGGFLMVTASGNEDQYNKWFIVLKQAAVWLILIGVAWFIVSMIFWLVNLFTTSSSWAGAGTAS